MDQVTKNATGKKRAEYVSNLKQRQMSKIGVSIHCLNERVMIPQLETRIKRGIRLRRNAMITASST